MKKIKHFILMACLFATTIALPTRAEALDAKTKMILKWSGYGTAGGALLGTALLAFGAKPRVIAQGASIGLYAGLGFGAYIIASHNARSGGDYNNYPVDDGGYYEGSSIYEAPQSYIESEDSKLIVSYDEQDGITRGVGTKRGDSAPQSIYVPIVSLIF